MDLCIQMFETLVLRAFTLRKGQALHGLRHLQMMVKKSCYETQPLEKALQEAFGDDDLIASSSTASSDRLKVAVTATSHAGTKSYILSNYNV